MEYLGSRPMAGLETDLGRVLGKDLFFYLFDLEVKRARRYQNFISIIVLKISPISEKGNGNNLKVCYQTLTNLLVEETRETDIIGSLSESRVAALLPYADVAAGGLARSRVETTLKYYDFVSRGYQVMVDQFCFPQNGTVISDFIRNTMGAETPKEEGQNRSADPKLSLASNPGEKK